ncbi:hypothetical protein Q9233_001819 [Columba guinea]|nr:hypothetical protein Q9233_001815 [Columba guinea]KAK2538901.1 hypothetical protein Q9233_001818 [Columba guinea]KAK2538902.1 hypothetical protein Q9233_001819 [Columba guinea]
MCIREGKLGDMLCFIQHPEDELMGHQEASLLQTLCTGPYLDMHKTAFWLQELMTAACVALLQSATCKLTVLPSPRFCKLKMTTAYEASPSIELVLAVQQGNSDTFVTMEKRSHQTASKQTASSSEDNSRLDVDKKEEEENLSIALNVGRISAQRLLDGPESFTMVVELVDELLRTCRKLSRDAFVPRPKPAIAVGNDIDGMSLREDHAVYHLLVPLKPPRGHSFHLEMDTVEAMPARKSRLRVELECTCRREDMLCFPHCCKEELRQNQSASLLDTLCTGHHLDMEKTTRWFQTLVKAAWVVLPQSTHRRLTVLPSRRSCKLRLTDRSSNTLLIEVMFGVQQDGSDTVLSIE